MDAPPQSFSVQLSTRVFHARECSQTHRQTHLRRKLHRNHSPTLFLPSSRRRWTSSIWKFHAPVKPLVISVLLTTVDSSKPSFKLPDVPTSKLLKNWNRSFLKHLPLWKASIYWFWTKSQNYNRKTQFSILQGNFA